MQAFASGAGLQCSPRPPGDWCFGAMCLQHPSPRHPQLLAHHLPQEVQWAEFSGHSGCQPQNRGHAYRLPSQLRCRDCFALQCGRHACKWQAELECTCKTLLQRDCLQWGNPFSMDAIHSQQGQDQRHTIAENQGNEAVASARVPHRLCWGLESFSSRADPAQGIESSFEDLGGLARGDADQPQHTAWCGGVAADGCSWLDGRLLAGTPSMAITRWQACNPLCRFQPWPYHPENHSGPPWGHTDGWILESVAWSRPSWANRWKPSRQACPQSCQLGVWIPMPERCGGQQIWWWRCV